MIAKLKRILKENEEQINHSDPQLDPGLLHSELDKHKNNPDIVTQIGQNPNARLDTILTAAAHLENNSHKVLDNPALAMMGLEDPSFLHKDFAHLPLKGLAELADNPLLPIEYQKILGQSPHSLVTRSLALNTKIHPEVADHLFNRAETDIINDMESYDGLTHDIHGNLATNPGISDELHKKYLSRLQDTDTFEAQQGLAVVANPKTDPDLVHSLVTTEPIPQIKNSLIGFATDHPNLKANTISNFLDHLKNNKDTEYMWSLLKHPNTSSKDLESHVIDHEFDNIVKSIVAKHPNSSERALRAVLRSTNHAKTLNDIFSHRNTTPDMRNMISSRLQRR